MVWWNFMNQKMRLYLPLFAAVANTFEPKSIQKVSGLSNATLPTIPNHKIQQTQALVLRKAKQIKSMPLPSSRLSIAVFFSVAGYSPVRTIKVRSKGKNGNII